MKGVFFLLLCISSFQGKSQGFTQDTILLNKYSAVINCLANDSLEGRPVSSIHEDKSAHYIAKELKIIKLGTTHFQKFRFRHHGRHYKSKNVVSFFNQNADSTIIIGAHYDHIERGSELSFSYSNRNAIHNGADDNASGIALLIGLANTAATWTKKKYNYIFVAYSGHEIGLYGSKYFTAYCKKTRLKIKLVLNFDMVGRLDSIAPVLSIYATPNLSQMQQIQLENQFQPLKIDLSDSSKVKHTDCKWFLQHKTPCISFTSGIHSDYHKVSDDVEKINYQGLLNIHRLIQEYMFRFIQ
ncbi:MAG: M28 family peptidase [Bacteroidia bacterium]|jgi:hypothetical protein|nr:M28 family peptidase [Bacteroidia bacterium]